MRRVRDGLSRFRRPRALLAAGLVVFIAGCASDAPQDTFKPEGPVAREIDDLVNPVFLIAAVVFVIVEVGVLLIMWRFRNRNGDDDSTLPAQVHGHTALELGWTILPALILTVVAVMTVNTIFNIDSRRDDAIDLSIEVVGKQWWWEYRYDLDNSGEPDIITANDLVIPAGETVSLSVTSDDVIHSFWIPRLSGKMDAVPGRHHPLVIEADAPGTFIGQCTEYCGLSHGYMHQRVVALPDDEFAAWLDHQQTDAEMPAEGSEARAGAELFVQMCSSCHLVSGVNDEEYAAVQEEFDLWESGARGEDGEPLVSEIDYGPERLVARNAPDLTHLMSRGVFAGGLFNLWEPEDGVTPEWSDIGGTFNRNGLEAWLRDAPGQKPMDPDAGRGMPNFNLNEEQVSDLLAFLETLD